MTINNKDWQTHITVAAVIHKDNKYLLVTDTTRDGLKLNQPAGHLDENESIIDAVIREVKEEAGVIFFPKYIIGIYLAKLNNNHTYLRICFSGDVDGDVDNPRPAIDDDGVVEAKWYSYEEIMKAQNLRTPLVIQCIEDYKANKQYPLELLKEYQDFTI